MISSDPISSASHINHSNHLNETISKKVASSASMLTSASRSSVSSPSSSLMSSSTSFSSGQISSSFSNPLELLASSALATTDRTSADGLVNNDQGIAQPNLRESRPQDSAFLGYVLKDAALHGRLEYLNAIIDSGRFREISTTDVGSALKNAALQGRLAYGVRLIKKIAQDNLEAHVKIFSR